MTLAGVHVWAVLAAVPVVFVACSLVYMTAMTIASRREPTRPHELRRGRARRRQAPLVEADPDLFFVYLLPCLNEAAVLSDTLAGLFQSPAPNFAALVIDDGSDDATGDVARQARAANDRVWIYERTAPNARQGKGEALNGAVDFVANYAALHNIDPRKLIIAVIDADGSLDLDAINWVAPRFADPQVGAVQIGVRIANRGDSVLARLQDMEFIVFTEIFQRGRRHLGSVGMGGNGQFMRLAALQSLGPKPWSKSLTEDLDLGVRLTCTGWRSDYCSDVAVHQQGVLSLNRLVRQRVRWFQGQLQGLGLLGRVARSAPYPAAADLLYSLTTPLLVIPASLLPVAFIASLVALLAGGAVAPATLALWISVSYVMTIGPALACTVVYSRRVRGEGVSQLALIGWAHGYVLYSLSWYVIGWRALARQFIGRSSWVKTERNAARGLVPREISFLRRPMFPIVATSACVAAGVVAVPLLQHHPVTRTHSVASGPWQVVFRGGGTAGVSASGGTIALSPAISRAPAQTHSALVVSRASYGNMSLEARVRTVRQLRIGSAPNPWEVGWVLWHYQDPNHFYALTLRPSGWVLSKQDPAYRGDERFLASGTRPRYALGIPHTVQITQVGARITVSADGHRLATFTDRQRPYLSGSVGAYTEDATAVFDHFSIGTPSAR